VLYAAFSAYVVQPQRGRCAIPPTPHAPYPTTTYTALHPLPPRGMRAGLPPSATTSIYRFLHGLSRLNNVAAALRWDYHCR